MQFLKKIWTRIETAYSTAEESPERPGMAPGEDQGARMAPPADEPPPPDPDMK